MVLGAVVCFIWEKISYHLTYDLFKTITKGGDDHKLKTFYTNKACRTFW